jgi:cytochrome P450
LALLRADPWSVVPSLEVDLRDLALFADCSAEDVAGLSDSVRAVREIADGEVLCHEGTASDHWWIVVQGTAAVTMGGIFIGEIGPGEPVGEMALLEDKPHQATVTATSDMVIQEVDGAGFTDALLRHPRLMLSLLREMAARLRRTGALAARPVPTETVVRARRPPRPEAAAASPALDVWSADFFTDPYSRYEVLRERDPVHFDTPLGAFILTRYDDVHRILRDRSLAVEIWRAHPSEVVDAEIARDRIAGGHVHRMMLRRDGDDHARLRHLVAKVFTPKAIGAWRERTEAVVEDLLSSAAEHKEIDVVADYALLLPARIIGEMLGMPNADIEQMREWSLALTKTFDPLNSPDEEAEGIDACRAMARYIEEVVADKRSSGSEDILTGLINAQLDGEVLTTEELIAQVALIYIAGHENTMNLIGNGLTHLFEFPEQLERLRTDPGVDTNAIEELIRFDSPVQFARRVAVEAVDADGSEVPAGSVLLLCLGAANRDPAKWGPSADILELMRPRANEHASFGGGPHHCLGSALARLEAQVALPRLLRRFPRLEPMSDEPQWGRRMLIRGVDELKVSLGN